jgi:hypothetical protein
LDVSLELASKPVGDVALLDIEERADEASSLSVIIEEAIESRALSGLRCTLTSGRGGLTWAPGLQQKVNQLTIIPTRVKHAHHAHQVRE